MQYQKLSSPIEKWREGPNRCLSKEDIQTAPALQSARLHSALQVPNVAYSSTRAATTKYHRLSGLTNRNLCSHSSRGWTCKATELTPQSFSEDLPPG